MICRLFSKCILSPQDISPLEDGFEVVGTFNPGIATYNKTTYFLIRVTEKPIATLDNHLSIPRVENGAMVIDWINEKNIHDKGLRGFRLKPENILCPTTISHLRLAKSSDGINIEEIGNSPIIYPEEEYEEYGVEDARITCLEDHYFITYVAVSRHGICTALASTKDFIKITKHGIIFPPENKDVVIFPEKISNKYIALHRPLSANPFGVPEIWSSASSNLFQWGNHLPVLGANQVNKDNHFSKSIGCGCPPIKTKKGWLEIFHGSYKINEEAEAGVYFIGAALLDLSTPNKVIGISKDPILMPEEDYERKGFLNDILFPTGAVLKEDELFIYSGTSDAYTAVIKVSLQEILSKII